MKSIRRVAALLPLPACGERVGVRGPFHKLDSRRGPLTRIAPSARSDLSPRAGRGKEATAISLNAQKLVAGTCPIGAKIRLASRNRV